LGVVRVWDGVTMVCGSEASASFVGKPTVAY
jgi:hypothetical protein